MQRFIIVAETEGILEADDHKELDHEKKKLESDKAKEEDVISLFKALVAEKVALGSGASGKPGPPSGAASSDASSAPPEPDAKKACVYPKDLKLTPDMSEEDMRALAPIPSTFYKDWKQQAWKVSYRNGLKSFSRAWALHTPEGAGRLILKELWKWAMEKGFEK